MAQVAILDPTQKQETTYCIPLWLRDEQVKIALSRIKGRIQPGPTRDEPIALVSYGPSLRDTWEEVRNYPYVLTCSGAHKFLVDRGIIPNWHIDVDPRPHKVDLMGTPDRRVEYLMASCCHPRMWDHLEGQNVKLWHSFDSSEEALRILPPQEWAITGGCSAGVRTLTLARFLGFKEAHVFGLDGCFKQGGASHAGDHPNTVKKGSMCVYDGIEYHTIPSMLEAARSAVHELDQLPDLKVTFHGEGLTQHMARNRVPKESETAGFVAFAKPELISADFRELNRRLHCDNPMYGVGGGKHAEAVMKIAAGMGTTSILDYGCGKGFLAKAIPYPIWEYDPAVPGKDASPRPADLVVCTDVLEHVEPEKIELVIGDLARCTAKVGYFVIHTGPAKKTYADGRNTHLIQRDDRWWSKKLAKCFVIGKLWKLGVELHYMVAPRGKKRMAGALI